MCTPLPGEAVEVGRGDAGEGLSLAGLHFHDPALVKDDGAHELDVEGPLAELSAGGFAHQRVRFRKERVDALSPGQTVSKLGRLLCKSRIRVCHDRRFKLIDLLHDRDQLLQVALVLRAQEERENVLEHTANVPFERLTGQGKPATMAKQMSRRFFTASIAVVIPVVVSVLSLVGCQKKEIEELVGTELFSLSLGKLDNQVDLFPSSGGNVEKKTRIYMRDGWFYLANGNSGKVMVFSSYGDLIFLLYNAQTNPAPVFMDQPAPSAPGKRKQRPEQDLARRPGQHTRRGQLSLHGHRRDRGRKR